MRRKFGHRGRESLWKMVGMYNCVGGICRVYIYFISDFSVVVLQYLLSSIDGDFIVSDGILPPVV